MLNDIKFDLYNTPTTEISLTRDHFCLCLKNPLQSQEWNNKHIPVSALLTSITLTTGTENLTNY